MRCAIDTIPGLAERRGFSVHGVLVVDKKKGQTSHDVVLQARRHFKQRRLGHAGTLDPMASGVLLLLFGEATKLGNYLTAQAKRYRAKVRFGWSTDTLDAEGDVVDTQPVTPRALGEGALERALSAELERTAQLPPNISAIKHHGRRAYALTRAGHTFTLTERKVSVHGLSLIRCGSDFVEVELTVSKGYYVRAFARDLGQRLGLLAHLSELSRLASGPFALTEAVSIPPEEPLPLVTMTEACRRCLPTATLSDEGVYRARRGQALLAGHFIQAPPTEQALPNDQTVAWQTVAWLDTKDELIALGKQTGSDCFTVVRGFNLSAGG